MWCGASRRCRASTNWLACSANRSPARRRLRVFRPMHDTATGTTAVAATGATAALAEFVSGVRARPVPASVREVLQAAVVDAVGCGLFGLTTPAARIVQEFAREQGGPP